MHRVPVQNPDGTATMPTKPSRARKWVEQGHKLSPSIRSNRELELRVVKELCQLFPVSTIVYEYVEAKGDKAFSPVMVGQKYMLQWLTRLAAVKTQYGWQTAQIRHQLGLEKTKNKSEQSPQSHAVDGVALACSQLLSYQTFHTANTHGHQWQGEVAITEALFVILRRPPISRRQLHLMVPTKGGVRRKYGGTTTRHGVRKGDYVLAEQAGRVSHGWVSGDTERQISVSDSRWKRLGQFTAKKVNLVARSTGLIVTGNKFPVSCSSVV